MVLEIRRLSKSFGGLKVIDDLSFGVAFVIVVLFLRGGVVEAWARFSAWRERKWRSSRQTG